MSALRRATDWTFRDRRTGAIVVGQWPNLPLWLFLGVSALRWILAPQGVPALSLRVAADVALAWWAGDEVLRGANPWRRFLGTAVLVWLVVSAADALLSRNPGS